MANLYLEFDQIIRRFTNANIRYAVVGGLAVGFYGYLRATEDIDFMVDTSDVSQVAEILVNLGYNDKKDPWRFKDNQLQLRRFIKHGDDPDNISVVDVLEAATSGNLKVLDKAVDIKYADISIKVVTASDLILMKKPQNSDKDKLDIDYLKDLLNEKK